MPKPCKARRQTERDLKRLDDDVEKRALAIGARFGECDEALVRMADDLLATTRRWAGGRPRGVTMPCGWGCGAVLTAREMREHFTTCRKKPTSTGLANPATPSVKHGPKTKTPRGKR